MGRRVPGAGGMAQMRAARGSEVNRRRGRPSMSTAVKRSAGSQTRSPVPAATAASSSSVHQHTDDCQATGIYSLHLLLWAYEGK